MKKYNFLAILLLSIVIFSCSKNKDITTPDIRNTTPDQALTSQNLAQAKLSVPEFNEKNSLKVTWSELPERLRNATRLEDAREQPQKNGVNAQASAVSYQFLVGPWGGTGGSPYYILANPWRQQDICYSCTQRGVCRCHYGLVCRC